MQQMKYDHYEHPDQFFTKIFFEPLSSDILRECSFFNNRGGGGEILRGVCEILSKRGVKNFAPPQQAENRARSRPFVA